MLVIVEAGSTLKCSGEKLQVHKEGRVVREVRMQDLESILASAGTGLSASAVRRLLKRGIDVTFIEQSGRLAGRLSGPHSKNVNLRVNQVRRADEPSFRLGIATSIVAAKLMNQRRILLRYRRRRGTEIIGEAATKLRRLSIKAEGAQDIDELRGFEGAGAAAYFETFGHLVSNRLFEFKGRNRRPPRDPINACLSFGYTLLGSLLDGRIASVGLDPMIGFLHSTDYGRPSLALDILEEFRAPIVDSLVLKLLNLRKLSPGDFGPPATADRENVAPWLEAEPLEPPAGIHLSRTGRPVFLRSFFETLRTEIVDPDRGDTVDFREHILRRCRMMARAVTSGDPTDYQPFRAIS